MKLDNVPDKLQVVPSAAHGDRDRWLDKISCFVFVDVIHLMYRTATFGGDKSVTPSCMFQYLGNLSCVRCGTASNLCVTHRVERSSLGARFLIRLIKLITDSGPFRSLGRLTLDHP